MEEGNYQSAAQVITSVSSVLNQEAKRDSRHQDDGRGPGEEGDMEQHRAMLDQKKQQRVEVMELGL